ncbi:MAG: PTS system fructose subfamily IIA component [Desulfuromonadaceae bacterium]|nr:PTS system fructose subfamily IIA component [Desulfuromonadaceae bacterium]
MVGLIITAHGRLAAEILRSATSIMGPLPQALALAIEYGADMEAVYNELRHAITEVDRDGDGVLIMTDMFGGTPANISNRFLNIPGIEVLNGVNLPMVLKFCGSRDSMTVEILADFLQRYGKKSIINTRDILGRMEG